MDATIMLHLILPKASHGHREEQPLTTVSSLEIYLGDGSSWGTLVSLPSGHAEVRYRIQRSTLSRARGVALEQVIVIF